MAVAPRVSIGLPVRNGERFLRRQLDSLLAQDFTDFEVIISDNASTDGTRAICEEYARRDSRVRYHRSDVDRGLAWNWNRAFELARAPYFKWAAHDDEHAPTFLSRCVEVLDTDESVVCCHAATVDIDEHGNVLRLWPARVTPASPSPHVRFGDMLRPYPAFQIYGLTRGDALRRTGLHRPIPEIDHALLAELALLGRIVEIPEPLFRRREHEARSVRAFRTARARWALYAGGTSSGQRWPGLQLSREMVRAVRNSPVEGRERLLCWLALRHWLARDARRLASVTVREALTRLGHGEAVAAAHTRSELLQTVKAALRGAPQVPSDLDRVRPGAGSARP